MNDVRKYLSMCLLATTALIVGAAPAWAQQLGSELGFAVLGSTNVTCTAPGAVIGDVGVSPGTFTNTTGCVITGATPPATNAPATAAQLALATDYGNFLTNSGSCTPKPGNLSGANLPPGVYCLDAVAKAGTLTLTGTNSPSDTWIFYVAGALTGTGFSVVMANGGAACNVYWVPSAGVTMTGSSFKGTILAGGIGGSITLTDTTIVGRVLADTAVTMTGSSVFGCSAPSVTPPICVPPPPSCDTDHRHHKHCKHRDNDPPHCDGDDDDNGHGSDSHWPFDSKHDDGGKGGKK
jgi:hypothetical protein